MSPETTVLLWRRKLRRETEGIIVFGRIRVRRQAETEQNATPGRLGPVAATKK